MKVKAALVIGPAFFLLSLCSASLRTAAAQQGGLVINGDGSTFAYPMYSNWIAEYQKADPGVHLSYVPNGSGAGIHDIMLGTVDFAGTDGPLTKTQLLDFATHRNCDILHFPMALGADVPIYKIPGIIQQLNFTPRALAGTYLGTITKWDDPEIAKPNPSISLPERQARQLLHRLQTSAASSQRLSRNAPASLSFVQRCKHLQEKLLVRQHPARNLSQPDEK